MLRIARVMPTKTKDLGSKGVQGIFRQDLQDEQDWRSHPIRDQKVLSWHLGGSHKIMFILLILSKTKVGRGLTMRENL